MGSGSLRIASMVSSATEMVCALGMGQHLVGRSHECDFPHWVADLPVCTRPRIPTGGDSREIDALVKRQLRDAISVYEVFPDVLERLRPTHILTQVQCEVCAVSLKDVEAALAGGVSSKPQVVPLNPNSLADVFDDAQRIAEALGQPEAGVALTERMRARMRAISRRALARSPIRPRVACIEWMEPLMAAGNWVPELVEMAGGVNLFGEAGKHSPWMRWEDLVTADPDVIVVMACGWDILRASGEMHWLTSRAGWGELKAVREGRVHVVDGNQFFNRPGPRLVESLEILAELLRR
jgi:iron complex transport system substrate-binding protein